MTKEIKTNAEYLALTTEAELLEPIKAYLYSFSKRFKTREAKDIYELTKTGKTIPTQNYNDYVQGVFVKLYELCQANPADNFKDTIYQATVKGISETWNSYYHQKDGKKASDENIDDYTEKLLSIKYNTEKDAINNATISELNVILTAKEKTIFKMITAGYTQKEIALILGTNENNINQKVSYARYKIKNTYYKGL